MTADLKILGTGEQPSPELPDEAVFVHPTETIEVAWPWMPRRLSMGGQLLFSRWLAKIVARGAFSVGDLQEAGSNPKATVVRFIESIEENDLYELMTLATGKTREWMDDEIMSGRSTMADVVESLILFWDMNNLGETLRGILSRLGVQMAATNQTPTPSAQ